MIKNAIIDLKAERDAFLKSNYVSREGVLFAKADLPVYKLAGFLIQNSTLDVRCS